MSSGVQCFDASGNLIFDSTTANILFLIDERVIASSSVGNGLTYTYPAYAGKKINAFLQITSGEFNIYGGGLMVPSCRVTYSNGTPVVTVFFDNPSSSMPKANAYLSVYYSGAPQ